MYTQTSQPSLETLGWKDSFSFHVTLFRCRSLECIFWNVSETFYIFSMPIILSSFQRRSLIASWNLILWFDFTKNPWNDFYTSGGIKICFQLHTLKDFTLRHMSFGYILRCALIRHIHTCLGWLILPIYISFFTVCV